MGTGKSLTALAKIAHIIAKNQINRALIICPATAVPNWEIEIATHTTMSYVGLKGGWLNKGELLTKNPYEDIYIISYDAIPGRKATKNILLGAMLEFGFDMVVCDEVTFIKNYETIRYKAILQLCDRAKQVLFLTGTPITNRPDTIFNIYRALDKGETFGTNFFKARSKYFFNPSAGFPVWKLREDKKDELHHKMYTNAVRVRKDECLSLPPKVFAPRYCELTDEQRKIYDPVADDLLKRFKVGAQKFRITTPLTKLAKLSQICSGFMYDNDGSPLYMEKSAKSELLKDILEELGNEEKVVIFTRWREDTKIVEGVVRGRGAFRTITGDTGQDDRKRAIQDFQTDPKVKTFIANITVGGYSVTLTAAAYCIYYSLNFALTDWLQSQDRIHRIGQTKTCIYIPLLSKDTMDEYIYRAVQDKVDLATSLVDPELIKRLEENLESSRK